MSTKIVQNKRPDLWRVAGRCQMVILGPANRPVRWAKRIGILILGLTANAAMVWGYNLVVYPYLIAHFGLLLGWTYAVFGSIALCLGCLWFYDVTGEDWLGIETIKRIRDRPATGRIRKFFRSIIDRGDTLAFFILCVKYDAFIVTVYMRRGVDNYAMSSRDWKIFWAGIVMSNFWFGLMVFGALEIFKAWLMPFTPSFLLNWISVLSGAVDVVGKWLWSPITFFFN